MALTKVTGQVINDTTGLVVGVTTVGGGISATDGFFSGIVTAVGDASFSGNVSVAGTLTYEDVTNIDAVGLVTARNGIVVGSGITLSKDGDIFATGITTISENLKVGTGVTISPDGDGFFTGVITATSYSGIDLSAVTGATGDFSIADKIVHTGDTNTAIRFPAADTITAETGGSERVRIDSSGRLLVGHNASIGADRHIQLVGNSADESTIEVIRQSADANAPKLDLSKSRNATKGSNTVVQDDDSLGEIHFRGDDGSDLFSAGATIVGIVDGTPGNNSVPGALLFRTTGQGEASTTERMRISKEGYVTQPNLPCFQVNGNPSSSNFSGYDNSWHSFSNVVHNNGSHYSNSTGRFTAPVNGFYHFTAGLWSANSDSTTGAYVMSIVRQDSDGSNSTSVAGANHVTERNQLAAAGGTYMTAGQTVRISYNGSIITSTPRNYFTGHLVG